jgi:hypothetical protein
MSVRSGIVLQKSFGGDERNFLGPLMRFVRRDVRDHIAYQKNGHGASCQRYRALQRRSRLKINFCEIFGVVRFSTFATLSVVKRTSLPTGPFPPLAQLRHRARSVSEGPVWHFSLSAPLPKC